MGTSLDWLRGWKGDGAFVFAVTPNDVAVARELHLPVVNLASHLATPGIPTVSTDHRAIGRLAAEHFLSKNFRRLAFYGTAEMHYSTERWAGFRECAEKRATLDHLLVPLPGQTNEYWENQEKKLDEWLKNLNRPVGIFAATDMRANIVLGASQRLGLKVPQDVAVLGVDNDPMVYELSDPPLSSVSRNDFEVGRRAAMLLESLIRQQGCSSDWVLIPPEGIVARESTRTLAVDDPVVSEAIQEIQNRIGQPFGVEEIAASAPLSRRRFEMRFREAVGCSPYAFITDQRVQSAKSLLEKSNPPSLVEIAEACGFGSATRFRLVFKRATGVLPSEWQGTPG